MARECPNGDCVISKTEQDLAVPKDERANHAAKAVALGLPARPPFVKARRKLSVASRTWVQVIGKHGGVESKSWSTFLILKTDNFILPAANAGLRPR